MERLLVLKESEFILATDEHRIGRPPDEDESISVKGEPEDSEVTSGA